MPKRKLIDTNNGLGINPFTVPLVIDVTEVINKAESYQVEHDKAIKIYNSVRAREMVNSLSPMASKFMNFVLFRLESGRDHVKLLATDFMEYGGVKSAKTFYSAAAELSRAGIISQVAGRKSIYWINPTVIFFGDRKKTFPSKVVIKAVYEKH